MKAKDFKSFISIIEKADCKNPIWHAGYAFMNLTTHQHERVWETLNARGFKHVLVHNFYDDFDGIELPTGLVLLKGGNGERW